MATAALRGGWSPGRVYGKIFSAVLVLHLSGLWISAQLPMTAEEDQEYRTARAKPFRIIGNIYFVGATLHNTSYLITTPEGHILLDTGHEESVQAVRESIESLGFQLRDVEIILSSHAHHDHIGGHALMKELTGASILATEADADVMSTGGKSDFRERAPWKPAKADRIIGDGERIQLGGVTLVAHLTPGHTKGCTTWTTVVNEGGQTYDIVFVGGMQVNTGVPLVRNSKYPNMVEDFARSFAKLKSMPCDIFLAAHGYWFNLWEKVKRLTQGARMNPFIDPQGYRNYIEERERAYLQRLKLERGEP